VDSEQNWDGQLEGVGDWLDVRAWVFVRVLQPLDFVVDEQVWGLFVDALVEDFVADVQAWDFVGLVLAEVGVQVAD